MIKRLTTTPDALRDAIATTRQRIREERGAIRIASGWDREHATRELAFYLALQRRQVARLRARTERFLSFTRDGRAIYVNGARGVMTMTTTNDTTTTRDDDEEAR